MSNIANLGKEINILKGATQLSLLELEDKINKLENIIVADNIKINKLEQTILHIQNIYSHLKNNERDVDYSNKNEN